MLRKAREEKGVHIGFLASVLRVPVDRLQALEEERLQDLPDLTFARALAQSVCRQLKIESAPVLAVMPDPDPKRSVRITAATGEPLSGMNNHPNDPKKKVVWISTLLVVLALWAMLGTHLFEDQSPSTSVQSPTTDADPAPTMPPPEPNSPSAPGAAVGGVTQSAAQPPSDGHPVPSSESMVAPSIQPATGPKP
jgi:cytoskeleton protein RodZ